MKIKTTYFLLVFTLLEMQLLAQSVKDTSILISAFHINYALQFPGGDLAERFGYNSAIGGGYHIKTKTNFIFGAEGNFIFGNKIKESGLFAGISTSDGNIIDGNGMLADIKTYERGFYFGAYTGKLFPVWGPNLNSGIFLKVGTGLLQHKIRIENPENAAPQLEGDYKKGYDKLTNGLAINEYVGYKYFSNSKLLNFMVGIECTQAFTQSRRSFDFNTMSADTKKRLDLLTGVKIGWMIPTNRRVPEQYYYY